MSAIYVVEQVLQPQGGIVGLNPIRTRFTTHDRARAEAHVAESPGRVLTVVEDPTESPAEA